jgi:hypothetical protein
MDPHSASGKGKWVYLDRRGTHLFVDFDSVPNKGFL